MSSTFVRAQLEESLNILAAPADAQREYLERLGVAPSADELALELADFVPMLPAAARDGVFSQHQVAAIQGVDAFARSFSGTTNAALWHVDALSTASEWKELRRLAWAALELLRPENAAQ